MSTSGFVDLVVEDDLSESICVRLLSGHQLHPGNIYGKEGFGYIRRGLNGFNRAAANASIRYFVLTDLDQNSCAARLWDEWVPRSKRHGNLIFRVAVREVESWLLADGEGLQGFMDLKSSPCYDKPDALPNPKQELLFLAEHARNRRVREALVFRTRHGQLVQGPDYNGTLRPFVQQEWNYRRAARRSESLRRAIAAVGLFRD